HHDVGRGGVGQAAAAEAQVDDVGDVVGEIGECGHAIDGGGGQGSLQGAAAGAAGGSKDGRVVAAAQGAGMIFSPDLRLLGKGNTGDGAAGRLGQDNQLAGCSAGYGQYAVDEAEGVIGGAQGPLGDGDWVSSDDVSTGGAQCGRAGDAAGSQSLAANKARISGRQSWVGIAGGAGLIVGPDRESCLGDRGCGCRLSEVVIDGIAPAQAQAGDVTHFAATDVLGSKSADGATRRQRHCVSADNARQRCTACIKSSAGG